MRTNIVVKIEELYLQIFKIVAIVVLSLALVASGVMLYMGISNLRELPTTPIPAAKAKKPNVEPGKFMEELDRKETEAGKSSATKSVTAIDPTEDPQDQMVEAFLLKLWAHFDRYQNQCGIPNPTDKNTFLQNFPRSILKEWFVKFGVEFAESQDRFQGLVLQNPKAIEICKQKQGKGQVFTKALDWHKSQWLKQVNAAAEFERSESIRVKNETEREDGRVSTLHAFGMTSLWAALGSFGVFMALALLLIISKIESNLRKIGTVERTTIGAA